MVEGIGYQTKRFNGSERHEALNGANRRKSIEYGLYVFLTPEQHRGTNGVHGKNGKDFSYYLKKQAQISYMNKFNKSKEDFIKEFKKNYL